MKTSAISFRFGLILICTWIAYANGTSYTFNCSFPAVSDPLAVLVTPNQTSYSAYDYITLSCVEGYTSTGADYSYCTSDNYWYPETVDLICFAGCPAPNVSVDVIHYPDGGNSSGTLEYYDHSVVINYACVEGFVGYLVGTETATCTDGVWEPAMTPLCLATATTPSTMESTKAPSTPAQTEYLSSTGSSTVLSSTLSEKMTSTTPNRGQTTSSTSKPGSLTSIMVSSSVAPTTQYERTTEVNAMSTSTSGQTYSVKTTPSKDPIATTQFTATHPQISVSSTVTQEPSGTTDSTPHPSTAGTILPPSTTDTTPPPSTKGNTPLPSTTGTTPPPSTTGTTPLPSTTGTTPVPSATGTAPCPSTTGTTLLSSTTGTTPRPSTTGTIPLPSTTGTTPRPSTTGTVPLLSTTGTTPRPSTTGTAPRPSTTGTTPLLSTTGTTPRPSTIVNTPLTSTKAITPSLSSTVTTSQTSTTGTTQGSSTTHQPHQPPSTVVTTLPPSSTDMFPRPSSTVTNSRPFGTTKLKTTTSRSPHISTTGVTLPPSTIGTSQHSSTTGTTPRPPTEPVERSTTVITEQTPSKSRTTTSAGGEKTTGRTAPRSTISTTRTSRTTETRNTGSTSSIAYRTTVVVQPTTPLTETKSFLAAIEIMEIDGEEASFTDDLNDPQSASYKQLELDVIIMANSLYGDLEGYVGCVVEGFTSGSIVASYYLEFESSSSVTEIDIQNETISELQSNSNQLDANGTTLGIDQNTFIVIEVITTTTSAPSTKNGVVTARPTDNDDEWLIIVYSVAGATGLIILVVIFLLLCGKRISKSCRKEQKLELFINGTVVTRGNQKSAEEGFPSGQSYRASKTAFPSYTSSTENVKPTPANAPLEMSTQLAEGDIDTYINVIEDDFDFDDYTDDEDDKATVLDDTRFPPPPSNLVATTHDTGPINSTAVVRGADVDLGIDNRSFNYM